MAYTGVVKNYNREKGWGFVSCEDLLGKDAFFLKSENKNNAARGDKVTFDLVDSEKGAKAHNIHVVSRGEGSYKGVVKAYSHERGFGFIVCEETEAIYHKDVFFMKSAVPGNFILPGALVYFGINVTDRGPKAVNIKVIDERFSPVQALNPAIFAREMQSPIQPLDQSTFMQPTVIDRMFWPMQQFQQPMFAPPLKKRMINFGCTCMTNYGPMTRISRGDANSDGVIRAGFVKNYSAEMGYGLVSTTNGDVFLSSRNLRLGPPPSVGDLVRFILAVGPRGPIALDAQTFPPESLGATFEGSIKSFDAKKGWGFATSPEANQFGDVLIHSRDCGGYAPQTNDRVSFSIRINYKGRFQASNVTFCGIDLNTCMVDSSRSQLD